MNHRVVALLVCTGLVLCVCCSKRPHSHAAACIIGKDTLTVSEVQTMGPDSASEKDKIARVALQMTLSREAKHPCGNAVEKGFYTDLSNQLSLQTGTTWPVQSAACLYGAAKAIRQKFKDLPSARAVAGYVDSLFSHTVQADSTVARSMAVNDSLLSQLGDKKTRQDLELLLRSIFHISAKTAYVLADFLISEETEKTSSADVSSVIKGLVADTHSHARPSSEASVEKAVVAQDPKLALKYRPQQVISDSIKKHIHNLEAIYKIQLKLHPELGGTVWVTFVILPDGTVASTQVHSADISTKDFLTPFSQYVQRIRFSKIPDTIGPMTFEFPFEFSPEN
jgi:hypothetical protein